MASLENTREREVLRLSDYAPNIAVIRHDIGVSTLTELIRVWVLDA